MPIETSVKQAIFEQGQMSLDDLYDMYPQLKQRSIARACMELRKQGYVKRVGVGIYRRV